MNDAVVSAESTVDFLISSVYSDGLYWLCDSCVYDTEMKHHFQHIHHLKISFTI